MKKILAGMNHKQVWAALILGLALLLSSGVIYALTLNGVSSSWSNAVGGSLSAFAVGCNSGGGTCTPIWRAGVGAVYSSPAVVETMISAAKP